MALFELTELASWPAMSDIDTATATLIRELVTAQVRNAAGHRRFDALTDMSALKPIALDLAGRMLDNPQGLRSHQEQVGAVSETNTYSTEALVVGARLSREERDEIRRLVGAPRAGSVRMVTGRYSPAC